MRMKRADPDRHGRPALGVAATALYQAMTRRYLKEPDPEAWLALADLFEEHGETKDAALWRRRAAWFPTLSTALLDRRPATHPGAGCRTICLGFWEFVFFSHNAPGLFAPRVEIEAARAAPPLLPWLWMRGVFRVAHAASRKTYWTERVLGVIDWCGAVEGGRS